VAGQDEVVLEAELVAKGEQARHFRAITSNGAAPAGGVVSLRWARAWRRSACPFSRDKRPAVKRRVSVGASWNFAWSCSSSAGEAGVKRPTEL
jgi:hypothetical protein